MDLLQCGELDLAFTRELTEKQRDSLSSHLLLQVPLMAVLPAGRELNGQRIEIAALAKDRFVLLDREQSPPLFDSIVQLCRSAGFLPRITSHAHLAESIFTLVKAGEGISIVPMWARVLVPDGLTCVRLIPDTVRTELVAAWSTASSSGPLRSFVALATEQTARIQAATERDIVQALGNLSCCGDTGVL